MSALLPVLDFLVAHGPTVALGASVVMVAGCLVAACCRNTAERHRLGVLTALACGVYLGLAWVPLPRWRLTLADPAPPASCAAVMAQPGSTASPSEAADERSLALLAQFAPDAVIPQPKPVGAAPPDGEAAAAEVPHEAPPLAALAPMSSPMPTWFSLGRAVAGTWLLLAGILLLRAMLGMWRLGRFLRASSPGPVALLAAANAPERTRLLIAANAGRPFCAWWGRPVIVLPRRLLDPARGSQALAVVRHEAAHLRAHDPFVQWLLTVLALPLGWHPLFWWLARDVRFHAELLADDAAAAATGRAAYARDLLDLADRAEPAIAGPGTVPVFHRPSEFFRRFQMLLQREGRLSAPTLWRRFAHLFAMGGLVALVAGTTGVPAIAQEPEPSPLQIQNEKLGAELESLRAELKLLKSLLKQQQQPPLMAPLPLLSGVSQERAYTVKEGDSLARIARSELGDEARVDGILRLNPGLDAKRLAVGQTILLPVAPKPQLDPNATPSPVAPAPTSRALVADGSGLPSQAVNLTPPPEQAATVTSTEATADLTTRSLDLQGELEVAEAEAAELRKLAEAGQVPALDAKRAAIHLATLRKKKELLARLVAGEILATESELQWLDRKRKDADKTDRLRLDIQVHRAQTRLQALRSVGR